MQRIRRLLLHRQPVLNNLSTGPWLKGNALKSGLGGGVLPSAGRTMLANLKSSLILDEGTGGPTWSRATKAWGFNELGYLEELASGCAFFGGARLVRNIAPKSETFTTGWSLGRAAMPVDGKLLDSVDAGTHRIYFAAATPGPGAYMAWFEVKAAEWSKCAVGVHSNTESGGVRVLFDLSTGVGEFHAGLIDGSFTSTLLADGWVKVIVRGNLTSASIGVFLYTANDSGVTNYTGDGTKGILVRKAMICDVTNYDASYIPEYVSVGVASAPFPAGIDGAKYFETDWQGAPIPTANLLGFRREAAATNNLLYSRDLTNQAISMSAKRWDITGTSGAELVTNGTFAADLANWTPTVGSGGSISATGGICTLVSDGSGYTGITNSATLTAGKTYVCTVIASGTGTLKFTSTLEIAGIGNGTNTFSFVATGTVITLARIAAVACNLAIDSISIKEAAVQCTRATGLDGIANTATTLTATAADAIILQPISGIASAARCASAYVKRRTGSGTISFTQDGGSTWTDITSQINGSTWARVQITSTLANPSVGFKISTSGDAIDVDCVQNEAGAVATSPIVTTTAAVTRNAESLTYQTASNWSDTAGTAYIEVQPLAWVAGGAIGSATNGLLLSAANSGATASDGTNTANGPAGSPSGREKLAVRWGGGAMTVASGGVVGTAGTYDGGMGLASVGIAVNSSTYCGPVAIYNYQMTDAELQAITT